VRTRCYPRKKERSLPSRSALVLLVALLAACGASKKAAETAAEPDPNATFRRGTEHLAKGRPDLAVRELETSVALIPDNPVFSYSLGLAYLGTADYERAAATFHQTLMVDPYFTDAHVALSIVYSELERHDEALREIDVALTDKRFLTPEVAYFNKGKILHALGRPEEAEIFLRRACTKKPDNIDWIVRHATVLEALDRPDDARARYQAAIDLAPTNQEALFRLAELLLKLDGRSEAFEYFLQTFELDPTSPLGQRAKARLHELR